MIWPNIHYELFECLGEGGQGSVFKALRRDRRSGLSDTVALKILHSENAVDLWKREFESLRRVRSPYCVQVLAFDRYRGRPALVLEFVDGASLLELKRAEILTNADIDEVIAQIELALDDLRSFHTFHGDLSPANVLVDRDGQIKLLDFGLANLGGSEARLTPEFAAPERLNGSQPDYFGDLFSLGEVEKFLRAKRGPLFRGYCESQPLNRRASGRPSTDLGRRELGFRVARYVDARKWARRCQTQTLGQNPAKAGSKTRWLAALSAALLLSTASASSRPKSHPWATLLVRTIKWHQIFVDGQPVGYSPVTVGVPADAEVRLSWSSAEGQGAKILHPKPGQRIVMGDRDFAH